MSDTGPTRPWGRWIGEAVVIVVSVFAAIYLEGVADDAERVDAAHSVLIQVAAELASDGDAIPAIRRQQAELATANENLRGWLEAAASSPPDSIQAGLDYVGFNNRTLYPSRGAWRTLTSAGHLTWISDRQLAARLADFYENRTVQLEYNGRDYDFNVNDVIRVTASRAWDFQRREAHRGGGADLVELSGQLRYLGTSWNPYYISLLDEYGVEIDRLLEEIGAYLALQGVACPTCPL